MRSEPIRTDIGYLEGRDAIFLDDVVYDKRSLTLKGEFNGDLCTENIDGYIGYEIKFNSIYYMRIIELDVSSEFLDDEVFRGRSSFYEIYDSDEIKSVQEARNLNYRHFMFWTYDDMFEIVCKDYELKILAAREK